MNLEDKSWVINLNNKIMGRTRDEAEILENSCASVISRCVRRFRGFASLFACLMNAWTRNNFAKAWIMYALTRCFSWGNLINPLSDCVNVNFGNFLFLVWRIFYEFRKLNHLRIKLSVLFVNRPGVRIGAVVFHFGMSCVRALTVLPTE